MNIYQVRLSSCLNASLIEFHEVREALRQINIQMIDSSNLYDGLESLWLGSADETLASPEVSRWRLMIRDRSNRQLGHE